MRNKRNRKSRNPACISHTLIPRNRSGQMEMSVGTIVTIVLLMTVLVLGIFFVQKIFRAGTNAIDTVDSQVQSELQKLFAGDEQTKTAFYPASREVIVKKTDTPKGFAFQIRNNDVEEATFTYAVTATDVSKCGSFSKTSADDMLLGGSGSVTVGRGDVSTARLVKFVVPESAPKCTMEFDLRVNKGTEAYDDINFFLVVK